MENRAWIKMIPKERNGYLYVALIGNNCNVIFLLPRFLTSKCKIEKGKKCVLCIENSFIRNSMVLTKVSAYQACF